ncbi:MAG: hypothetical protein GY760_22750 [Deltaproteobacteria bacterium]|nr:hypothetical protein [Deltaproteobacteria bacterium]
MKKNILIAFLIFVSCSNGSGKKEEKRIEYNDISKISKKVLLIKKIENKGVLKLNELSDGKQVITITNSSNGIVLNQVFSKDTIVHSFDFTGSLDLLNFEALDTLNRVKYYWDISKNKLYFRSLNNQNGKEYRSENIEQSPALKSFIKKENFSVIRKVTNPPELKYFLKNEESVFQSNSIKASVSGTVFDVPGKESCLMLVDQNDYDGDGYKDALLENAVACGGNCCPNSFFIVTYKGDGNFKVLDSFNSSWEGADLQKWKGRWSIVTKFVNAGSNTSDYYESRSRHMLINGETVLVEFDEKKEIEALMNIRAKEFDISKVNQSKNYRFDLDGDGEKELMQCKLWNRWGVVQCEIKRKEKIILKNIGGKRVGVLKRKTNGMHDIVSNHEEIYKWNGSEYKKEK